MSLPSDDRPTTLPADPTVTVVIPCRNERSHIEDCLRGILEQTPPPGGFEVIVADGGSDDGTRAILEQLAAASAGLRVIDNPRRIVSAGLNAAIRAARGRIIVRMDAHTRYAPDYVRECVAALAASGADNVGGPWVARGDRYLSRAIAAAFQSPFAAGGARGHDPDYAGPVDTVYLGCWPAATFRAHGLFDEELVRNQDDEHNLRLTRGGGRVWQSPRIRSWYTPRGSLVALFRQYSQYGYWKVRVIRKHHRPAAVRHLVPALFVATLGLCLLGAPFSGLLRALGLAALAAYLVGVLGAALATAARTEWRFAPVLPAVFAMYHFGYGLGFLQGLIDFAILRRRAARASATVLTREPAAAQGVPR